MKLMVLTAACWPTEEMARKRMWVFLESCKKFGIEPHLYGIGTQSFPGYAEMKVGHQLRYLEANQEGYTHVLYTDGWDAFFVASQEEILAKYAALGSPPMLASASDGLGNVPSPELDYPGVFPEDVAYRYPCVGGYMGEMQHVIEMFRKLDVPTAPKHYGDDCFRWYDGYRDGWFRPMLDSGCEIFQVTDKAVQAHFGPTNNFPHARLYNMNTKSYPCVFHISGGYTDQVEGKDRTIVPWARKLKVII